MKLINEFDIDGCKVFYLYKSNSIYVHQNLFRQYVNIFQSLDLSHKLKLNNINFYFEKLTNDYEKGITIILGDDHYIL